MTLSVDVGGTFTDFVIIEEEIKHFKVPSTPSNPEDAIANGLTREPYSGDVFHGTTVATNAILEGEGVETAFITNQGFEDILFIGRQNRPHLYRLNVSRPKPPLKKENCFGLAGRIDSRGKVIESLDEEQVKRLAQKLEEKDLSAAVCLLHSYQNPEHELEVGRKLDEWGVPYSLSNQVSREFREYERGMTTLLDAHLLPLIKDYFSSVTDIIGKEPMIMKSSGGLEPALSVDPVDTFYSGPAGGVAGGVHISQLSGVDNIVTFDMGGTSADMAAIVGGEMYWKDEGRISGFPVQSRMVDIVTVGSGGGSIARVDEGGALRVGPQSSGAEPGPVCYGRGGEKPTITDALLMMGYIDPDYFLGGEMELDKEGARKSMEELADELGMGFEETLLGIFRVANSNMARTMKEITVEKGLDPERFAILGFGGAGPLHAAYLGKELNISHVMIPPLPGVFSALGIATGDVVRDYHRTLITSLSNRELVEEAVEELREKAEDGQEKVLLGLRYKGQSYHIYVEDGEDVEERFHRKHETKFGYSNEDVPIEVIKVHLEIRKTREVEKFPTEFGEGRKREQRKCLFPEGKFDTDVYYRRGISPETEGPGPAIIEDTNSTLLVPPGWKFFVDENGIVHMKEVKR